MWAPTSSPVPTQAAAIMVLTAAMEAMEAMVDTEVVEAGEVVDTIPAAAAAQDATGVDYMVDDMAEDTGGVAVRTVDYAEEGSEGISILWAGR